LEITQLELKISPEEVDIVEGLCLHPSTATFVNDGVRMSDTVGGRNPAAVDR